MTARGQSPVDLPYFDGIEALAAWADLLIVTCPATPETIGLVNGAVLASLGPEGYLVNSRAHDRRRTGAHHGARRKRIAGAALDVFEKEPFVPEALRHRPARRPLAAHGHGTRETRQQMGDSMVAALWSISRAATRDRSQEPLPTPAPPVNGEGFVPCTLAPRPYPRLLPSR
ncbi:hypothetical protein F2981_25835 (plasmid) [Sinorhizobium meliloti]|nr:hypothetical protein [Sinorhizobium meliloti]